MRINGNKPKKKTKKRHAEWRLLKFVYGLLLGNCGYQTNRKIYDQREIAFRLRSSRDPRATKL